MTSIPGMITQVSSPDLRNAPMMSISLSTMTITYARAVTISARMSTFAGISSSEQDETMSRARVKFTE